MKHLVLLSITLLFLAVAVNGQGLGVGNTVESFSLPDLNGRIQAVEQVKGRNGTVLIFLSAQCPVVKAYKDRINQIAAEAHGKGINFIGINSVPAESVGVIKANASAWGFKFPILHDKDNVVADAFDARTAPEVFLLMARTSCSIAAPSTMTVQARPSRSNTSALRSTNPSPANPS